MPPWNICPMSCQGRGPGRRVSQLALQVGGLSLFRLRMAVRVRTFRLSSVGLPQAPITVQPLGWGYVSSAIPATPSPHQTTSRTRSLSKRAFASPVSMGLPRGESSTHRTLPLSTYPYCVVSSPSSSSNVTAFSRLFVARALALFEVRLPRPLLSEPELPIASI